MMKKVFFTLLLSFLAVNLIPAQQKPPEGPIFVDGGGNTLISESFTKNKGTLEKLAKDLVNYLKADTLMVFVDSLNENVKIHVIGKANEAPCMQIAMRDDNIIIMHLYDFVPQLTISQKIEQFLRKRNYVYESGIHHQLGYFHYTYFIQP